MRHCWVILCAWASLWLAVPEASAALITNVITTKSGGTEVYPVDTLTAGKSYYIDRTHDIQSIPAIIAGAEYIRTGNDEKGDANLNINFTLTEPATIYLLVDARNGDSSVLNSAWAGTAGFNFTKTGLTISSGTDAASNPRSIWSQTFAAGTYDFKSNFGNNTYVIVATPVAIPEPSLLLGICGGLVLWQVRRLRRACH